MSESDKVECPVHGTQEMAFVCQHLAQGEKQGFHLGYDPDHPDELWPDAWCDACEAVLEQEGEWNEKTEQFADIKLVCAQCYEALRALNWTQNESAFVALVQESYADLEPKQKTFLAEYKADVHERWDWDQDRAKLIFSHNGAPQVEADIQFAGTLSTQSKTWMWAWANQSLSEQVKAASRTVKALGESTGFMALVAGRQDADEVDGWQLTTIMAQHVGAIGVYRTPDENGYTYMVITQAKWLSDADQSV